jgi:hypothetical protein
MVKRKCRLCGVGLPKSRYFNCKTCVPSMDTIDEDFIYHGGVFDDDISISEMPTLDLYTNNNMRNLNEVFKK